MAEVGRGASPVLPLLVERIPIVKKVDVVVGETYLVKVSGRLVPTRIDSVSAYGGWNATNLLTQRKIRVRSAMRLRCRATQPTS